MNLHIPQHSHWKAFLPYAAAYLVAVVGAAITGYPVILLIPFILAGLPMLAGNLRYLLLVLLFTIPLSAEYHFTPALGLDFPDEPLMMASAGIGILLLIHKPLLLKSAWPAHSLTTVLLLLVCWGAVTSIYGVNTILSLKYLAAKCWYLIAFVAMPLLLLRKTKHWIMGAVCIAVPMTGLVIQSIARHAVLGFSFESVNLTVSPYFRNHVTYGAAVVVMLPLLAAAQPWVKQRGWKWTGRVLLILFLAAIILSYSRGAWLAIPVALVTVWAVRKKLVLWLLALALSGMTITAGWLLSNNRYLDYRPDYNKTIFHTDFEDHLTATYTGRDMSTTERFYRWIAATRMAAERPFMGVGPNNFYDSYKPYTASAFKTYVSHNPEHSTVHNYFLLLLTEQGLPGLLLFVLLLYLLFFHLQRQYHRETDPVYRRMLLAVTAILAMLVTVNFLSDLIETDKTGSIFLLCIAFTVHTGLRQKAVTAHPDLNTNQVE